MSSTEAAALRRAELARRVDALPAEVEGWSNRARDELDMNAHFSQLEALSVFIGALVDRQRTLLQNLQPDGGGEPFRATAFDLVREIIKTQRVWDFFRDKLELRFSPDFKDVLWAADTVAWDCYRPVMDRAVQAGIVPAAQVREPPLTYLTAEFSPATWVRGSRPNDGREYDLGTATLPIPVIEVPWDHLGNLWELVSLQHEVGHDIEADLKLRPQLLAALQAALQAANTPAERVQRWLAWEGEIFADLVGLQLGGPAFSLGLMHLLLLPSAQVTTFNADDPHPTHWIRVLMNAAYIRTLVAGNQQLDDAAAAIEATWTELYPSAPDLNAFKADFAAVFEGLMDTKLVALKDKTVRELMPYTATDDTKIRQAAAWLQSGNNAPASKSMSPRHAVSAARLAAAAAVEADLNGGAGGDDLGTVLGKINERVVELIRDQAVEGLRAGETSNAHKEFVASFADRLSEAP